MNKLIVNITVGIVIGIVIIFVMYLYDQKSASPPGALHAKSALGGGIDLLEQKLAQGTLLPNEVVQLSNAYRESIRAQGNAQYYEKLEELIAYDQENNGDSPTLWALKASVAAGKHTFEEANNHIDKALETEKSRAMYFGQKGDITLELGLYDEAIENYQTMVDMRPDFHSYTRIAHVRTLYGEVEGSIELYEKAITSGAPTVENIAWAYVEMGKVQMSDDLEIARTSFDKALAALPAYAPAYAGLSKVAYALGNVEQAQQLALQAFDTLPTAEYAILLGDIYSLSGEKQRASQQYALAETAFTLSTKQGIVTDAEYADFLSRRNIKNEKSLEMASRAVLVRPSVPTMDTYMWSQYRAGDIQAAKKTFQEIMSNDALQGVAQEDASLLFHGGIILDAAGEKEQGEQYINQALKINPHFSPIESSLIKKYTDENTL